MTKATSLNLEKCIKYICYFLLGLFTAVCVYYINLDAQWQIGDDSLVMQRIGYGEPFEFFYTIWPESGRLFPTAYWSYNPLVWLIDGPISPTIVYIYQSIFFLLMVITAMWLFVKIQPKDDNMWKYPIALLATLIIVIRKYEEFANCFSTGWFSSSLTFVQILLLIYFIQTKRIVYGLCYFIIAVYLTYGVESAFMSPMTIGILGLLLLKQQNTKKEKIFYWALIVDALIYLLIYLFYIFPRIEDVYDSAHGSQLGYFMNAIKMLIAQKIFWIAIPLLLLRLWEIIKNKKNASIFDVLLISAAAICCGNFVLKLDRPVYYIGLSIVCLIVIVYYARIYFKPYWACVLMLLFSIFYGCRLPYKIQTIHEGRINSKNVIDAIVNRMHSGDNVIYYNPSMDSVDGNLGIREWRFHTINVYLEYVTGEKNFEAPMTKDFSKGCVIVTQDYDESAGFSNIKVEQTCEQIARFRYYKVWTSR